MRIVSNTRKGKHPRQSAIVRRYFHEGPARLCDDARLYRHIARMVQQLPDVRYQRIDAVRQKLHSGEYIIDSKHLVELILEAARDTRHDYRVAA